MHYIKEEIACPTCSRLSYIMVLYNEKYLDKKNLIKEKIANEFRSCGCEELDFEIYKRFRNMDDEIIPKEI